MSKKYSDDEIIELLQKFRDAKAELWYKSVIDMSKILHMSQKELAAAAIALFSPTELVRLTKKNDLSFTRKSTKNYLE